MEPRDDDTSSENDPNHVVGDTLRILRDAPRQALLVLQHRIDSGAGDYRTWHNYAVAKANVGDLEGALEAVAVSLEQAPASVMTQFLYGKLLQEADRFADALTAYERVEELDPSCPRLYANQGVVRFFLDDTEGAVRDLTKALQADPQDTASLFNLAVVHMAAKSFRNAQQALEQLITLEPDRAAYYYQFLVELGRAQVIDETLTQSHRIKNFMGIVGDRLRRVCGSDIDMLEADVRDDLLAVRDDYERVYGDLVIFLRAIQPRPIRLRTADLRRLLDRVVFVAVDKSSKVRVRREFEANLPEVHCDPDMLQEAFLNLLLNAIDAVEEGPREEGEVVIQARVQGDGVQVAFVDEGVGIRPGDLDRIFQFGFTTKSLGTGIGLSFTRKIVEQHGGKMEVESETGRGTSIRCFLPAKPQISETLTNQAFRVQLFQHPRELILEEPGVDLGI